MNLFFAANHSMQRRVSETKMLFARARDGNMAQCKFPASWAFPAWAGLNSPEHRPKVWQGVCSTYATTLLTYARGMEAWGLIHHWCKPGFTRHTKNQGELVMRVLCFYAKCRDVVTTALYRHTAIVGFPWAAGLLQASHTHRLRGFLTPKSLNISSNDMYLYVQSVTNYLHSARPVGSQSAKYEPIKDNELA